MLGANITELTDPTPTAKRRKTRGKYTVFTPKDRADIGRYALENGNEKARRHFLASFPNIKESTIRNFKLAYKKEMEAQRKLAAPKPVDKILAQPRGRPQYCWSLTRNF